MEIINNPKLAHIVNLIAIANLDGKITEEEKALLFHIADSLGVTDEEFDSCVKHCTESPTTIEVPETDEEKTFFLKNLTTMMMIDGIIDEKEKAYIKMVAEKFGYDGDKALDILINSVYEDFKKACGDSTQAGDGTTRQDKGGTTRQGEAGNTGMADEELKKEILQRVSLGKKALEEHNIAQAFEYLLIPAHLDGTALRLLLMIPNTHTRMYLLTEKQIKQVKEFAEKGYALSQYIYGRYLQMRWSNNDDIEEAIKNLEAAAKAGIPDAFCAIAYLIRDGHYGLVDKAAYMNRIDEALDKGSMLATKKYFMRLIFGQDGVEANPQAAIDSIEKWLKGRKGDDLLSVNPIHYELLGDAYAELGDKEKAGESYMKAIEMGYNEAYSKYCALHMYDLDTEELKEMYLNMLDVGCSQDDPGCHVYKAAFLMDHYDEYDAEKQKEITLEIKEELETAAKLGSDMAPYFLGNAYYYGNYGFEEDNTEAWNWFIEGMHREDSFADNMLAQMIIDNTVPYEISDELLEFCQLTALRHGDKDQLRNVVKAYKSGKLTFAAAEIEQYYLPEYESLPPEDEEEDEDDEASEEEHEEDHEEDHEGDDGPEYKLIGIVKTNGKADIHEFDVEYWDELAPMIDAKRLDAIRTQPLYDLSEEMGYRNKHITAWVDNMGLLKELPMNPVGCRLYPGPIAGDMILTLEDSKYNPMSFENMDELKQIIAKLGAKLDQILIS